MEIRLTRDSVAMSDDCDAPHERIVTLHDSASIEEIIRHVFHSNYLASIAGGKATWSATSSTTVAVIAQQWPEPKMLQGEESVQQKLKFSNGVLYLHFNYHTQQDPELIYAHLLNQQAS
ncbi:hypothetical protein KB206_02900 [Microvirga sp. STS02]|uniref:hypothetical protein n=1 Tax=Hymenobacter negativus TaxID=2795026 RepID=UPI0018DE38EC|nr:MULTISPECIES: hypothetical protein [Bacteria]MBH8567813.1 hypothetical protein [Hymenobacter negativus]MBR7207549.1 hypothetical protein [Microvirga sp. STS02]